MFGPSIDQFELIFHKSSNKGSVLRKFGLWIHLLAQSEVSECSRWRGLVRPAFFVPTTGY